MKLWGVSSSHFRATQKPEVNHSSGLFCSPRHEHVDLEAQAGINSGMVGFFWGGKIGSEE